MTKKLSVVHRKPQNLRHFQNISLHLASKIIIDYISNAFCLFFVTALMVLAEQWPLPAWGHLLPKSLHHVWDACKLSTRYIFILKLTYPAYRFTVAHMWKHFVNTSHFLHFIKFHKSMQGVAQDIQHLLISCHTSTNTNLYLLNSQWSLLC